MKRKKNKPNRKKKNRKIGDESEILSQDVVCTGLSRVLCKQDFVKYVTSVVVALMHITEENESYLQVPRTLSQCHAKSSSSSLL